MANQSELEDAWMRGYLLCLSSTIAEQGVSTAERERFNGVARPTAKECRRLGLTSFDCKMLAKVRAQTK